MTDKNLYINDLIHRFPAHTFTETAEGDLTRVDFLDGGMAVVASAKTLDVVDAYRQIRADVLDGSEPLFLQTAAERDALTNIDAGTATLTDDVLETDPGTGFESVALTAAYGEMFEDTPAGTALSTSTDLWETATAGTLDGNGIVTFASNQLVVGAGGDGDYMVSFYANAANSGGSLTTATIRQNSVAVTGIKDSHTGDSAKSEDITSSGILSLVENDTIELHIVASVGVDVITVFQVNVNIHRIS